MPSEIKQFGGLFLILVLVPLIGILRSIIGDRFSTIDFGIAILILFVSIISGACVAIIFTRGRFFEIEKKIETILGNVHNDMEMVQKEFKNIHDLPERCQNCVDDLKCNFNLLQDVVDLMLAKYGIEPEALVPFQKLKEIEGNVNEKSEIWVSTSTLGLEETILKQTVFDNINKQIKYVYFLPRDTERLKNRLVSLFNEGVMKWGKPIEETNLVLNIYEVPKHFVYLNFIIYDAASSNKPIVLFVLPQKDKTEAEELYYRVPDGDAEIFIESLNQLKGQNMCSNVTKMNINPYFTVFN